MIMKKYRIHKIAIKLRRVIKWSRRLESNQNLARNKRSIAYNMYMLPGTKSGDERRKLLAEASKSFSEVIELVDKHGVPEKAGEKKEKLSKMFPSP